MSHQLPAHLAPLPLEKTSQVRNTCGPHTLTLTRRHAIHLFRGVILTRRGHDVTTFGFCLLRHTGFALATVLLALKLYMKHLQCPTVLLMISVCFFRDSGPDTSASPLCGRRGNVAEGALPKIPPTPPSPRNLITYGHRKCHSLGYKCV